VAAEDKALVAGPEGRMPLKLSEKHIQRVVDTLDTSIEHFVSLMVENNPTTIRSRPRCHLYCFIKEDGRQVF
jgi:hypothetical protein